MKLYIGYIGVYVYVGLDVYVCMKVSRFAALSRAHVHVNVLNYVWLRRSICICMYMS